MKKQLLFLVLFFFCTEVFGQNFQWAKKIGSSENDYGKTIKIDPYGNIIVSGWFQGTVDFDPSATGVYSLTSLGVSDIFIMKLDALGNLIWVKTLGNTGLYHSLALDALGNIYYTGTFSGIVDFDPSIGVYNMVASSSPSSFVSKLDNNGNFVWAKKCGQLFNQEIKAITVDATSQNILMTGKFYQTVDFDPGSGIYNLISGADINAFVCKLDTAGNFVWAKKMFTNFISFGYSIIADAGGNIYTIGNFTGQVDFDPSDTQTHNLISNGGADIFILKLDASGNFIWVNQIGGSGDEYARELVQDNLGNIYFTGTFEKTVDFDPSTTSSFNLTTSDLNTSNIFVCKLDPLGNFVWAKQITAVSVAGANAIAIDAGSNIYVTGYFTRTADFDPSIMTFNLISTNSDIFVLKLNEAGNFIWARNFGSASSAYGTSIAADNSGNVYTTGSFSQTVDFDPSNGNYNLTTSGKNDVFISKLSESVLPITFLNFQASKSKNNSYLTWQTATETNTDKFELEKSEDGIVFRKIGEVKAAGNSNTIKSYQFTDFNAALNLSKQIIYYRFKQIDFDGKFTYSPIRSIKFDDKVYGLQAYPNPAKDFITIQINNIEETLTYYIIDQTGKKVLNGNLKNSNIASINIAGLASGIYFIQMGETSKEVVKFIKQ